MAVAPLFRSLVAVGTNLHLPTDTHLYTPIKTSHTFRLARFRRVASPGLALPRLSLTTAFGAKPKTALACSMPCSPISHRIIADRNGTSRRMRRAMRAPTDSRLESARFGSGSPAGKPSSQSLCEDGGTEASAGLLFFLRTI